MNKITWSIAVVVIFAALVVLSFMAVPRKIQSGETTVTASAFDPTNATYVIEGQSVTLVNGKFEASAAPDSATETTTTLFERAAGDLNGDGRSDAAVILVQNPGGSGTFYYVAAAINTPSGAQGTNAILLGDRIAPQNISIKNEAVVMNYADRNPGEPFSTPPSVGITKYFAYANSMLKEFPVPTQ